MSGTNPALDDPTSGLPPVLTEGALVDLQGFAALSGTAGHIELLNKKINALNAARVDSWNQVLTALARIYSAGEFSDADLYRLLYVMADSYGAGYTRIWDRNMPILAKHVVGRERSRVARAEAEAANQPNGLNGSWVGELPFNAYTQPVPLKGIAVVYVLYDEQCEPVYHGSSDNLRSRLKRHEQEKPDAKHWVAIRCRDREHAYQVEVGNLRQYLPRLNKKASR